MKKEEYLKEISLIKKRMVKFTDWAVGILGVIGLLFIFTIFLNNYTATAIGLFLIGCAITLKLFTLKKRPSPKTILYIWIVIIILIAVLLGIQYVIPKISFG